MSPIDDHHEHRRDTVVEVAQPVDERDGRGEDDVEHSAEPVALESRLPLARVALFRDECRAQVRRPTRWRGRVRHEI